MSDETNNDEDKGGPFTPSERKLMREMLDNYEHSRWLFVFTMKVAKFVAIIAAGIAAYKTLPGLLK
jgi:hypothetical protein